jgi:flagellar biosynthetic protein FlhB
MADESLLEKTEQATPKRREDARKKGQVAKSAEVNSAFVLLLGLGILYFGGMSLYSKITGSMREIFINSTKFSFTLQDIQHLFSVMIYNIGLVLFPVMLGLMVIGMVGSISQVGFLLTPEPLTPKFDRLNPFNGLKRIIISKRSLVELLKGLIKIGVIGFVGWLSVRSFLNESLPLMDSDVATILSFLCRASISVAFKIALVMLGLAGLDYLVQRRLFENEIKMTKEEVKEEMKQLEGDPLIRSRIRSIQRQLARKRMMAEVPKAAVVITNPTHLAIALKYEVGEQNAPKVVAKGADLIAEKIRTIAKDNDVPIIEDKPLAQLLYKSVEVDQFIPEALYQAVAQVLAYIYKLKNKTIEISKALV